MRTSDVKKALRALDGIIEITKNDQLMQGAYVDDEVDETLKAEGAICGGRKACLIGSLYIGYGERVINSANLPTLEGVDGTDRLAYMRNRPGLRLAYKALNEAAIKYGKKHNLHYGDIEGVGEAETLFEEGLFNYSQEEINKVILEVTRNAKRAIKREYKDQLSEGSDSVRTPVAV